MRPFRGKRIDNGKEVKGWYCEVDKKSYILRDEYHDPLITPWYEVIPESVGQDTGYKTYEGDILAKPNDEEDWKTGRAERVVVEYDEELTAFLCVWHTFYGGRGYAGNRKGAMIAALIKPKYMVDGSRPLDYIKAGWVVVGNKYKNPELLEVKE